ncbi:MAG TPA: helix-turn-helix domain-containing protein [Bacteroidales bacterium]
MKSANDYNCCPVKDILGRIGDKWTLHVVLLLGEKKTLRFNEIKNNVNGISQRMLAVTLRSLEHDGLVKRTLYAGVPPRADYELTPMGLGLYGQFQSLVVWAEQNMEDIMKSRRNFEIDGNQ